MTNPSPTLARIQAEHPELVSKKPDGSKELVDGIVPHRLLVAAVTDLDRQIADLEAENARLKQELENARAQALADRAFQSENARLREQLAEADEAVLGTCEQEQFGKAYDASLARQEQRRKERE